MFILFVMIKTLGTTREAMHNKFIEVDSNFHKLLQELYESVFYSCNCNSRESLASDWDKGPYLNRVFFSRKVASCVGTDCLLVE